VLSPRKEATVATSPEGWSDHCSLATGAHSMYLHCTESSVFDSIFDVKCPKSKRMNTILTPPCCVSALEVYQRERERERERERKRGEALPRWIPELSLCTNNWMHFFPSFLTIGLSNVAELSNVKWREREGGRGGERERQD